MKRILSSMIQPSIFILIGAVARIVPHPANFVPIAAMALFGGTYLNKKQALILPLAAMVLSDFIIGFDSLHMRISVYGSFLIMVLVGFWIKKHKNIKSIVAASVFSSIIFFVITNFAVWAFGTMYPKSLLGLIECYILAIPFFRNTLLGDLTYTGIFFGSYEYLFSFMPKNKPTFNIEAS